MPGCPRQGTTRLGLVWGSGFQISAGAGAEARGLFPHASESSVLACLQLLAAFVGLGSSAEHCDECGPANLLLVRSSI